MNGLFFVPANASSGSRGLYTQWFLIVPECQTTPD
jgi:hypothetical protein